MASIQILEISPAETPIEELSYDATGNITGGGALGDFVKEILFGALAEAFDLIRDTITLCIDAGGDPVGCVDAVLDEL